ncbi:hypothetical protein B9Q00_01065 [Candidatus Marsarchaeota G1 archaeon OSP_C]|uniref:Uncharacterized protein n=2 Tax=Candidatus Marsarchaeota group 1 TaxID=2203770 RepID=A0A2R6ATB5_9ARCH|nr:MAG: hypothetical protein B9Q00_01065 [Candidatus Marsarchaeota G1 archaeon OSP_C]
MAQSEATQAEVYTESLLTALGIASKNQNVTLAINTFNSLIKNMLALNSSLVSFLELQGNPNFVYYGYQKTLEVDGVVYALASYPPYFVNASVQLLLVNASRNTYIFTLAYHFVVNGENVLPLIGVTTNPNSIVILQNNKILIFSNSQNVYLTINIASELLINCYLKA